MRIDRNIIKDDRYPINKVKNLLRDAGAVKGDLVTISILVVNDLHIASIFACAEMGLRIIILDSPATLESLPYTKLALHGPSKFYIYDSVGDDTTFVYNGLHDEMLRRYGGIPIDASQDASNEYFEVEVYPHDPFLMSSTSGTTKPSRPVLFSHKEVYSISKRAIDIFKFDDNSRVCHTRNLHHASAMLTSLFPSLMSTKQHSYWPIGHDLSVDGRALLIGYRHMHRLNLTHMMIPNKATLLDFLESIDKPFDNTLNINMCGFSLDQSFVELAERYNVEFHSHYGSIDTAIPLLVNFVNKDSVVKENSLGVLPDDFYKTTLENGRMKVEHEWWDEPRYMDDELEMIDGQYIIYPKQRSDLELPKGFDITPFFQDTKINYEQLRGHLNDRLYRD